MEAELSHRKNSDRSPDLTERESPRDLRLASIVLSSEEIKIMKCLEKSGTRLLQHQLTSRSHNSNRDSDRREGDNKQLTHPAYLDYLPDIHRKLTRRYSEALLRSKTFLSKHRPENASHDDKSR